jgi:arabinogalactan oligomer/maltooligosaccharide transport system permease protein
VIAKIVLLTLSLSILGTLSLAAFASGEAEIGIFISIAIIALAVTYLTKISVPMKFFLPGMILLAAFVVVPIAYTLTMSVYKYQTGNYISKPEAITQDLLIGIQSDPEGTTFDVRIGKDSAGNFELLASDLTNNSFFLTTEAKKTPLKSDQVSLDEFGVAVTAPGFTIFSDSELAKNGEQVSKTRFAFKPNYFLLTEGFDVASLNTQSLTYDSKTDTFTNKTEGLTYKDNGRGNFVNTADPTDILPVGWRAPIWFENFVKLATDPKISGPLFSVFIWTMVFASLTVLTQFALGLLIAIALDKKIRGRRFYRTILILPYAMPSLMSILIWGGMFQTDFGAINTLLGTHIAWFNDPWFARAAVLVVNLWLGFPYFYLVSSGSLQAIPAELAEAASVDGANPRQIFRRITLPLLLQILAPLLIASFAFNFNNFNLIFLLTGGGPRDELAGEVAGATDILISYTYRIAFSGTSHNLGLASAISVVIFVIVAAISLYGIKKTKVLDEF